VFKATVKGLLAHKVRFLMTALAVVLGVSFMAGTFMLTDTINNTFNTLFAQTAVGKDTTVRSRTSFKSTGFDAADVQRAPVPASLVTTLRQLPGVKVADGVVQGYAQLVGHDGKPIGGGHGPPTFGANWLPDRQLSSFTVRLGRGPTTADEIAIDARTFTGKGFHLGDRVTVLTTQVPRQFTLVGSLGFGSQDNLGGATFVIFEGSTAQQLLGHPGQWDTIDVAAQPGVSSADLTQRIADALPPQYESVTAASVAAATAKSIEHSIGMFTTFLLVFAGVALFVGAFIIFNTFSILVTQRTRELALLRAIGASRRQVNRSVIAEAAIVGVLASLLGLGAGALLALGMEALFKALGFGLPTSSLQLLPRTVIFSLVIGTTVTLVSSIIPAWRASRVPPLAAMTEAALSEQSSLRRRTTIGAAVGGVGLATLLTGLFAHISNAALIVGFGAAAVFIAVAMLSPLVVTPMARVLGAPLAAVGGMTGRLSQQNAMRNPKRTASTAAALMVGVALVTVIATLGATIRATVGRVIDESIKADYIVSPNGGGGGGGGPGMGFSPDVTKKLAARPELAAVSAGRQATWHNGSSTKDLVAVDPATAGDVISFTMTGGSVSSLAQGDVLVADSIATSHHLKVGEPLTMGFDASGTQHLTIGGTYKPNEFVGSYVISLATYDQNYPKGGLDQLVFVKDRAPAAAALAAVKEVIAGYPNLTVKDQTTFKASEKNRISTLLNLVYVLLGFSILIAIIGIVNTLALSVIERTRELGLMRAVGMMRRQVRRMIRGEAIVVCLIGALLGVAVGLGLGLALVSAIHFDTGTVLTIPAGTLAVVVVLAGLAGVAAAIGPARRAAKLDVLTAIATT
jgi:putative ABC transport system permease protein